MGKRTLRKDYYREFFGLFQEAVKQACGRFTVDIVRIEGLCEDE
ncbi:MAG: hypothetical protein DIU61_008520 [Bacteroidota bacterium]|jgi:hypothetical protein